MKLFLRPPELAGLSLGKKSEQWVAYLYQREGYKVLERNYALFGKKQLGELDIVCVRGRDLVAVEVRSRKRETFMAIEDSLTSQKQNRLRRMILLFVDKHPEYVDYNLRIDLAAVLLSPIDNSIESVRIIPNAVEGK